MIEVIPAVIPGKLETIREKFSLVKGLTKKVQIDFVDGLYAPPISWPFNHGQEEEFSKIFIGEEKFPFLDEFEVEADLFIKGPEEFLQKLITIGFKNFVVHLDSTDNLFECLETAKKAGGQVGIGIKPNGDWQKLEQFLNKCHFVQIMGNDKVGYNHLELDERVLDKIKDFNLLHPEIPLQIDIGVNFSTVAKLKAVGITRFVSETTIFESDMPPAEAIKKIIES